MRKSRSTQPLATLFTIFFVCISAIFIINACRKMDRYLDKPDYINAESKFFEQRNSTDPVVRSVIAFVKEQNKKYKFVEDVIKKIGYPYWNDAIVIKKPGNNSVNRSVETESGHAADVVFVPFAKDSQDVVNAALRVTMTSTDTTYNFLCDWQYTDTAATKMEGKDLALLLMVLDNNVFGDTLFEITDTNLFRTPEGRSVPYISVTNQSINDVGTSGRLIAYEYTFTVCYGSWVPLNQGQVVGCPPGPDCPFYYFHTWCESISWISYEDDGTGDPPSGGGDPGTGGGSGSGWNPPTPPEPCGGTAGRNYPIAGCEPGWVPVSGEPPSGTTYSEFDPTIDNNDPDMQWWADETTTFPPQTKPSWAQVNSNFPKKPDGTEMCGEQVYDLIGGQVRAMMPPSRNACALRVSRALNYSGVNIPNIPGHTFQGADNKYYFLSTAKLYNWMRKTFGQPSVELNYSQGGTNGSNFQSHLVGRKGIYLMQVNFPAQFGALGHTSLYTGASCVPHNCDGIQNNGCYFDATGGIHKIYLWELQ